MLVEWFVISGAEVCPACDRAATIIGHARFYADAPIDLPGRHRIVGRLLHGPPQREVCSGMVRRLATFATGETGDQLDGGGGGNADPAVDPAQVSTGAHSILLAVGLSKPKYPRRACTYCTQSSSGLCNNVTLAAAENPRISDREWSPCRSTTRPRRSADYRTCRRRAPGTRFAYLWARNPETHAVDCTRRRACRTRPDRRRPAAPERTGGPVSPTCPPPAVARYPRRPNRSPLYWTSSATNRPRSSHRRSLRQAK